MKTKSEYWIILYILSSLFSSFFFGFHSTVICEEICWFLFLPTVPLRITTAFSQHESGEE